MSEKRCYTVQELQEILGVSRSTIYRMFRHVFTPILDRYGVLQQDRPYMDISS